jgi:hypothetical protein
MGVDLSLPSLLALLGLSPRAPKLTKGEPTPSPLPSTEKGLALRELGGLSRTTLFS